MLNLEEKRKAMFKGELTHDEYYLEYAEALGRDKIEALIKSQELNENSKLSEWDMLQQPILSIAANAYSNKKISKRGMSLSEVVCIAKVTFRNMK